MSLSSVGVVLAVALLFAFSCKGEGGGFVVQWESLHTVLPIVKPGTRYTGIAAAQDYSLALTSDGKVVAWGYNFSGQCWVPDGLAGITAVAAGQNHSLALRSNGTVVAWGYVRGSQYFTPQRYRLG